MSRTSNYLVTYGNRAWMVRVHTVISIFYPKWKMKKMENGHPFSIFHLR